MEEALTRLRALDNLSTRCPTCNTLVWYTLKMGPGDKAYVSSFHSKNGRLPGHCCCRQLEAEISKKNRSKKT